MADQEWAGVRDRIAALSALPRRGEVFGSLGHRWALENPLGEDELAELEAQLRVRLPAQYRAFLT
ncbi:hypothetical protein [Streptomyces minutiscleroticus]